MKCCLALLSTLALVAACKTDAPAPSAGSAAATTDGTGAHRSGKIDLPRARSALPSADGEPPREPPADGDRGVRREDRRAMLDTDGDGEITAEEFAAGQRLRAEEMHTRLDTNGDGKVMIDELSDVRMARRFEAATLDADHDGEISTEELRASLEKRRAFREQRRQEREKRGEGWGGGAGWRGSGAGSGSGSAP